MSRLREYIGDHADILALSVLIAITIVRSFGPVFPMPMMERSAMQDCASPEMVFRAPICPDLSPFTMGQVDQVHREIQDAQLAIRELRYRVQ